MSKPTIVQKRALDVTPINHGIWCRIQKGEPFVNAIVNRRWSDDGLISIMLDTCNFDKWHPEEMVDVVEIEPLYRGEHLRKFLEEDAKRMNVEFSYQI